MTDARVRLGFRPSRRLRRLTRAARAISESVECVFASRDRKGAETVNRSLASSFKVER
jgi:hypothetical protein